MKNRTLLSKDVDRVNLALSHFGIKDINYIAQNIYVEYIVKYILY